MSLFYFKLTEYIVSLLIVTLLYKKYFVSPNKFNVHRQLLTNWTSFVSNDLDFELCSMIGIRRIRILIVNIIKKIAIYHKKITKSTIWFHEPLSIQCYHGHLVCQSRVSVRMKLRFSKGPRAFKKICCTNLSTRTYELKQHNYVLNAN